MKKDIKNTILIIVLIIFIPCNDGNGECQFKRILKDIYISIDKYTKSLEIKEDIIDKYKIIFANNLND